MHLSLGIKTQQLQIYDFFSTKPEPTFFVRILADGMYENCILKRLFDKQLLSHHFPEAKNIIWNAEYLDLEKGDAITAVLVIYSSVSWLKYMEDLKIFSKQPIMTIKSLKNKRILIM